MRVGRGSLARCGSCAQLCEQTGVGWWRSTKIGDMVQLKSGGPKMTVTDPETFGGIEAMWFAGAKREHGTFPEDALEPVAEEKMSATEGAQFMVQLLQYGELRQDDAANQLNLKFGEDHVYYNAQGNLAIKPEMLVVFRKLTTDVVWVKGSRYCRPRQPGDQPGRQQPY